MRKASFLGTVAAALLSTTSLVLSADAAFDFTGKPALASLAGCPSAKPGTAAPLVDKAKTKFEKNDIVLAAFTSPVEGRKMTMYLGKDASDPTCFATELGSTDFCRYDFELAGNWTGLRGCGWSAPDLVSRKGYEVRNNTVYLEWSDVFADGHRQASRYAYTVTIAMPTTVNLETNVKILEDSGIKNFNVTGLSFDTESGEGRFIYIDFQMNSRWPNNLTLADNGAVTLPGFRGNVTVAQYTLPTCVKTDGSNSTTFTTDDFCYQSGSIKIDVGPQCNVGGAYSFNFDTHCFPNSGTNNDCTGKVLSANALIGSPNENGELTLDLCGGLFAQVADVTAIMISDQPLSYQMVPYQTNGPLSYATWTFVAPIVDPMKMTVSNTNCTMGGPNINNGVPKPCAVFLDTSRPQTTLERFFIAATIDGNSIKMVVLYYYIYTDTHHGYLIAGTLSGYYQPPTMPSKLTAAIVADAYSKRVNGAFYDILSVVTMVAEPLPPTPPPTFPARMRMAKRQVDGYQFGDTIKLTTIFDSPDLPIYESRLTKLILQRTNVTRSPNLGSTTSFLRNRNTTLVDSNLGPTGPGALSQLAINSNFTYIPGSTIVNMTMVPNMMPRDSPSKDYSDLSFLTTDDFDSVTEYTFYATFRVYFDRATSASNGASRRRRRLLTRDVSVPSSAMRQTTNINTQISKPYSGPTRDPDVDFTELLAPATTGAQPTVTSSPTYSAYMPLYIGLAAACAVFAIGNCILCGLFFCSRRRERRRHAGSSVESAMFGASYEKMLE